MPPMCMHMYMCQGEIVLHPADEGQKPETAPQGLFALFFFWHCTLDFFMYMYIFNMYMYSGKVGTTRTDHEHACIN